jgi:hypothetical protein
MSVFSARFATLQGYRRELYFPGLTIHTRTNYFRKKIAINRPLAVYYVGEGSTN